MKKTSGKSTPIPTRFDIAENELIAALAKETGVSQSEIIRRCVKLALAHSAKDNDLTWLIGNPDKIAAILGQKTQQQKEADGAIDSIFETKAAKEPAEYKAASQKVPPDQRSA